MAVSKRLDYSIPQQAWEPQDYFDSGGAVIGFRGAAVLHGGADLGQLYQAASDGRVYETETGLKDNAVAIKLKGTTKRYAMGGYVAMPHSLFIRLEAVTDRLAFTVTVGGAEYGEIEREYDVDLTGSNDLEVKVRLHRELIGRWIQIEFTGDVSNRPAIREMAVSYLPMRTGRVSASAGVDNPGTDPGTIGGLIVYLNSTIGLSGSHGVAITTWPDQSGGARDATQATAGRRPALQTTSNLSPTGKQMVLFAGVGTDNDNLAWATNLPARTDVTIIVYGKPIIGTPGALQNCFIPYSSPSGARPQLFVRTHPDCGSFTSGGNAGSKTFLGTTTSHEWTEFPAEDSKHRFWAWRFKAPEGASGIVSAFRGDNAGLVKGADKTAWEWTETSAAGYNVSNAQAGDSGWRGTVGIVLRYHAALSDDQIEDIYQWIKTEFGFD